MPHAARHETPAGQGENKPKQRSLGASSPASLREDKHLPAIASLLDPTQFDLVTRSDGLVVVQGGAGSGKTTVGLHRVAYLAFADPSRFRPDRMMVVVPHDALRHYVERVLPSLGVEGVRITTFNRFADRILPDLFPNVPSKRSDETPSVVMRVKEHAAMLRAVETTAPRKHDELDGAVERAMQKWPDAEKVIAAWKATRTDSVAPDGRVSVFAAWTVGKRKIATAIDASTLPDATRAARWSRSAVICAESIARGARRVGRAAHVASGSHGDVFEHAAGRRTIFRDADRSRERLVLETRAHFGGRRARRRKRRPRFRGRADLAAALATLARSACRLERSKPLRYAHLFVDEVQDATPIALRVLLDLTTKDQRVTLAGDTAQRMLSDDDGRRRVQLDEAPFRASCRARDARAAPRVVSIYR